MTGAYMNSIQLGALDHYFADFINSLDEVPSEALWLAAAMVSFANCQGHVCLDLPDSTGLEVLPYRQPDQIRRAPAADAWLAALSSCSTVGTPGAYRPLVLDDAGRLYLHRSWTYECAIADALINMAAECCYPVEGLGDALDRLFPPDSDAPDWQRAAALAALSGRLTVISGGPGTGKTTTVARILALMIEQAGGNALHIALAAPTGKAAARLGQSIRQSAVQLSLSETVRVRLPDKVQTLHRLLGVLPQSQQFRHNRHNPLSCDVLVVDEVSMVDLPLMAKLLQALPGHCRLIMLGDQDQLASVEAGAVLADICNHGISPCFSKRFFGLLKQYGVPVEGADLQSDQAPQPLADSVITLSKSYRFGGESGIGQLSRKINAGQPEEAFEILSGQQAADLCWRELPVAGDFEGLYSAAVKDGYQELLAAVQPQEALEALDRFRVLTPYRNGIQGVAGLNELALAALGLKSSEGYAWLPRTPLMVTGNHYELGLFNGDTAIVMEDADGQAAVFPAADGSLRRIALQRLPDAVPALALTVHKSQGSEFDRLLLILSDHDSELLTRELLYTAITRARKKVELWCSREVFCRAVERRIERSSGLRDRLWGEMAQQ